VDAFLSRLVAHPLLAGHRHFTDMDLGEWIMAIAAVLVSVWTIWLSVGYALHPGETEPDHIKRLILADDVEVPARRQPATPTPPPPPP
jgi:hypothetical protein